MLVAKPQTKTEIRKISSKNVGKCEYVNFVVVAGGVKSARKMVTIIPMQIASGIKDEAASRSLCSKFEIVDFFDIFASKHLDTNHLKKFPFI